MTAPTLGWANPSASPGRAPDRGRSHGADSHRFESPQLTRKSAQSDVISSQHYFGTFSFVAYSILTEAWSATPPEGWKPGGPLPTAPQAKGRIASKW
jgi:hypothetical protein